MKKRSKQKLEDQWIMRGDFDKHVSTWHLEFHHGRHRPRGSYNVRFVYGEWKRPGKILTWESILP